MGLGSSLTAVSFAARGLAHNFAFLMLAATVHAALLPIRDWSAASLLADEIAALTFQPAERRGPVRAASPRAADGPRREAARIGSLVAGALSPYSEKRSGCRPSKP